MLPAEWVLSAQNSTVPGADGPGHAALEVQSPALGDRAADQFVAGAPVSFASFPVSGPSLASLPDSAASVS